MTESTESFEHWCEACGKTEVMTSGEAYRKGWDFPPRMGQWGVISLRTCPTCPMNRPVGWAVALDGYDAKHLSPEQRVIAARIVAEGPDGEGQNECGRWPLTSCWQEACHSLSKSCETTCPGTQGVRRVRRGTQSSPQIGVLADAHPEGRGRLPLAHPIGMGLRPRAPVS